MRYFPVFFTFLLITISGITLANADAVISGPVCIIDGNKLQVGGKVKNQKCWGGINVRLHGSIAPSLNDKCTDSRGKVWDCGGIAKDMLASMIKMNNISCYHLDGEFEGVIPIATCLSGHSDLSLEMVRIGLAKVHNQSKRYELEEKDAKQSKRGLWK